MLRKSAFGLILFTSVFAGRVCLADAASTILLPANVTVAPGQCGPFSVALATPAGPGDVSVTLSSSDPSTVSLALSPQNSYVCQRRRARVPKWRTTFRQFFAPPFPLQRSSQNGPRRQGFATSRPTTARP
jgi:hypothetical protein